jgi:hypothetical protein
MSATLPTSRGTGEDRPSISDLQRARIHALRSGDRRRAAAYALVVRERVTAAQEAARHEVA